MRSFASATSSEKESTSLSIAGVDLGGFAIPKIIVHSDAKTHCSDIPKVTPFQVTSSRATGETLGRSLACLFGKYRQRQPFGMPNDR
jgi:hypothetical protein